MRRVARVGGFLGVLCLTAWPVVVAGQATPKVTIVSPAEGSTVTGPSVEVKLRIENFKTVDAGTPVAAGEGHAHLFLDRNPAAAGEVISTTESNIVHLGKAPYDSRAVTLQPGRHTITAQLADASHKALTPVVTAKVTFTVAAAGASPPATTGETGDGSLATPGLGLGAVLALGLAAAALGARRVSRG